MNKSQRQAKLVEEINKRKKVSVNDLSDIFEAVSYTHLKVSIFCRCIHTVN